MPSHHRVQRTQFFDDSAHGRLTLVAPGYTAVLSSRNGALLELRDASGIRLLRAAGTCLWATALPSSVLGASGCSYGRSRPDGFSYRWNAFKAVLSLQYTGGASAMDVTASLTARETSLDLQLILTNRTSSVLESVFFPADLAADVSAVEAGYAPNYLPGIRFAPSFFSRVGNDILTYPSRWAFADYLALDLAGDHLAMFSVNPDPDPLQPVDLGFQHTAAGSCSGSSFCVSHRYRTWIAANGGDWKSAPVRIEVGPTAEESIRDYRTANGIDAYPSVADKLGSKLDSVVRAPLIKADLWKGLPPFSEWQPDLERLPSPALLHLVAFQPGGHDSGYPDFLPPDPRWGSTADLQGLVDASHRRGDLVAPYLNVSWWNDGTPTLAGLPASAPVDFSVRAPDGTPMLQSFGPHSGYVVSPSVPFVRQRVASLIDQWRTDVPADCLFFDQLGARPWQRDFNPTEPTPLAYYDSWLSLMAPYRDRCLMVEDGWDRLADSFVGFHGGVLLMDAIGEPDAEWGAGNWEPYPLALWLLHDKVLFYQHDLFDQTMTTDLGVLTFNIAFGFMLSYEWSGWTDTLDSPWLGLVGGFQRALGPYYAGKPLTTYTTIAPSVTQTTFGDLSVVANWNPAAGYDDAGNGLAPHGFSASVPDRVVAGAFAGTFEGAELTPGTHYLLIQNDGGGVTVQQPVGDDTPLSVEVPASWNGVHVDALAAGNISLGAVDAKLEGGRAVFEYSSTLGGQPVALYRITAA